MTDRETDALVAERVLCEPGPYLYLPHYTTDPAADYTVLVRVRETWKQSMQHRWASAMRNLQNERMAGQRLVDLPADLLLAYQVGDYSRAALDALGADAADRSAREREAATGASSDF